MKQIILVIFLIQNLFGFSQVRYEWVNAPVVLGEPYEYRSELNDYLLLHGDIKEIKQKKVNVWGGWGEVLVKFDEAGNLDYFLEVSYPSSTSTIGHFLEITYEYDSKNRRVSECKTEILEGDTLSDRTKGTSTWLGPYLFEPIEINEYGHSKVTAIAEDTTFSAYDEFGRKIMDSIPFSRNTEGKINTYRYYTDSIYCEKSWSARYNVPSEREMYLLDKHENWIEKRLYWDNDRNYTEFFTRKIIYRE